MGYDQIERLAGLGVVTVVAGGVVWILLRLSGRDVRRRDTLVLGYPADLFPHHTVTQNPSLQGLAATQSRLFSVYRQLPAQSDLCIWLRLFLVELREIMDTAYRATLITGPYGEPARLKLLAAEVQQIEGEIAEHIARRLLARDADAQD